MNNWYLIHTKIHQELVALKSLECQGFQCFLSTILVEKLRRGALRAVQEPLFPRYLFIRLSKRLKSQSWSPVRSTRGVSSLVTFRKAPAKIADDLIYQLKVKTDSAEVQLRHFELGKQVILTDGPFVGVETIYQMADARGRVMVLLNILTKQVKISVPLFSIRKIN